MKRNVVLHRVMTGGVPSEPAEGTQYGELPEYEGDTEFDVSRPQSCKLNILFLTRMQTCYVVGSKNLYICTRICICFFSDLNVISNILSKNLCSCLVPMHFIKFFNKRQDFEITFNCFYSQFKSIFFRRKTIFLFEFYLCERNKIVNG